MRRSCDLKQLSQREVEGPPLKFAERSDLRTVRVATLVCHWMDVGPSPDLAVTSGFVSFFLAFSFFFSVAFLCSFLFLFLAYVHFFFSLFSCLFIFLMPSFFMV